MSIYLLLSIRYQRLLVLLILLIWSFTSRAQLPDQFQKVDLVTGLSNVINFEFAPDGRIFILDRYGQLIIYKPDIQTQVLAGNLPVFHDFEDGLIGIAFDPAFSTNQYLYLHYSPPSPSVNRVSRFTMNADLLDINSEIVLLEWATQRSSCCHAGGDMAFDSRGNLYIATGDNTHHTLYAPLDEANNDLSAEKSSSNTNDLRGKILRIQPQSAGGYTIPAGNLFPAGVGGLPEIYVMGARNPFQIFVDKENTDWLFWGEVGPDANTDGPDGPRGLDEINLTKEAGNYGWPYFSGKNEPYLNNYSNPQFYYNPVSPVNLSTWNTGATELPPAQPSWLEFFHKSYLAGPRYYFDPDLNHPKRLPVEFDKAFFYFDFNTSAVWVVKMDQNGNVLSNQQLAPLVFPIEQHGFIDMKVGPDGHLYILEYGAGCCPYDVTGGKLVRVDYVGEITNSPPLVKLAADPANGPVPLTVNFSSAGTSDPEGGPLTFQWDFQGDGTVDSSQPNPVFTYTKSGVYQAKLTVSDDQNGVSSKTITIHAGNAAATFDFISPAAGGLFNWGDDVLFDVTVTDKEDGTSANGSIDCNDVQVRSSAIHLDHQHYTQTFKQCQGSALASVDEQIGINAGGASLATSFGFFLEDLYRAGGDGFTNTVEIKGTNDDILYQSEVFGNFSYAIPVQDPGLYTVKLHFAEIYHGVQVSGGPGDRVFNVSIENIPVLANFDILSETAPATALVKEFNQVSITDGHLNIQFNNVVDNAKVSAIEILNYSVLDIYGSDPVSLGLTATYVDQGGLASSGQIELFPMRHEAEFYDIENDIVIMQNNDPWGGGKSVIRVNHGSYIAFLGRNLANISSIKYRANTGGVGGKIELRLDGPQGTLVNSIDIDGGGSEGQWVDYIIPLTDPTGKHDLFLVFKNNPGDNHLFDLNYLEFEGPGISVDNSPPEILEITATSSSTLQVIFSEYVTESTAIDHSNYTIDNQINVEQATLAPDNRTVILTTSTLNAGINYSLAVKNVQNKAGLPVVPGSYPFSLVPSPPGQKVTRLKMYPNPAFQQVKIEVDLITAEEVYLTIYDVMGRIFYFEQTFFETGKNILNLDLQTFSDGIYYLKINSRGTNITGRKLVIKNHN